MFSLHGSPPPNVVREMQSLYNNRTELIAPNTSLAAVMITCIKGRYGSVYRCMIIYFSDASEKVGSVILLLKLMVNIFNTKMKYQLF